ncbi:MAG: BON domain-containing protein, partial [Acidobacteria bacterium]|nr:BON domain-containing protein [Acidobacteriota bacterium]
GPAIPVGITPPTAIPGAVPLKPTANLAPPARVAPGLRPGEHGSETRAYTHPARAVEPYRPAAAVQPAARSWTRPAAIAVLVLLLAVGGGLYVMQSQKAAEVRTARTDADIQADVNRVLSSPDLTRQASVQAGVKEGVVTLTGTAESQFASEMADGLVRGMEGVRVVRNQITVKPPPTSVASGTETQPTSDAEAQAAPSQAAPRRDRLAEPPAEGAAVRGRRERARQLLATAQEQVRQGNYEAAIQSLEEAQRLEPANNFVREALRRARRAQETEKEILRRRR